LRFQQFTAGLAVSHHSSWSAGIASNEVNIILFLNLRSEVTFALNQL